MSFIAEGKINLTYVLIVLVLSVIVGGGMLVFLYQQKDIGQEGQLLFLPRYNYNLKYNLVYCFGHSSTVNEIKIENGKVAEPKRDGPLAMEAYDYKCYLLETDKFSREELTVQEINNLSLITTENSPNGLKIIKEEAKAPEGILGGLVVSNVYLFKGPIKRLIVREYSPTEVFRLIGWVSK